MTNKLTRDELNEVVYTYGKNHIAHRMAVELMAAMDSEPVAYISKADLDSGYPHILARRDFNKACTMAVYAAPQPAPVVPDEKVYPKGKPISDYQMGLEIGRADGWNACRAAMLNGGKS